MAEAILDPGERTPCLDGKQGAFAVSCRVENKRTGGSATAEPSGQFIDVVVEVPDLLDAVLDDRVERGSEKHSAVAGGFPSYDLPVGVALDDAGLSGDARVDAVKVPAGMAGLQTGVNGVSVVGVGDGRLVGSFHPPVVVHGAIFPLCVEPQRRAVAENGDLFPLGQKAVEGFALGRERGLMRLKRDDERVEVGDAGGREFVNVDEFVDIAVFWRGRESVLGPDAIEDEADRFHRGSD